MIGSVNSDSVPTPQLSVYAAEGAFAEKLRGYMAITRYGQVSEMAGLVSYLAGPEAAFITGANLEIDGGFTV